MEPSLPNVSLQGVHTFNLGRRRKECTGRRTVESRIRDRERKEKESNDLIKLRC